MSLIESLQCWAAEVTSPGPFVVTAVGLVTIKVISVEALCGCGDGRGGNGPGRDVDAVFLGICGRVSSCVCGGVDVVVLGWVSAVSSDDGGLVSDGQLSHRVFFRRRGLTEGVVWVVRMVLACSWPCSVGS